MSAVVDLCNGDDDKVDADVHTQEGKRTSALAVNRRCCPIDGDDDKEEEAGTGSGGNSDPL